MKINRFDEFVKENLNEGTIQAPPTTRPTIPEKPGKPIRRPQVMPDPKAEFQEEDDFEPNDGFDSEGFDSEEDFEDEYMDDTMDDEESPLRPSRTVHSFDDFQTDDEDLSDDEEFTGELSEREPDESDYMPNFDSEDESDFDGEEEEEEAGEYKGEVEMRRLADMLGTEVINNQIEYNGKKINYFSETEMFHVDRKKFETPEDVIEYLEGGSTAPTNQPNPMETDGDEEGFEEESPMKEKERNMALESRRFRRR